MTKDFHAAVACSHLAQLWPVPFYKRTFSGNFVTVLLHCDCTVLSIPLGTNCSQ